MLFSDGTIGKRRLCLKDVIESTGSDISGKQTSVPHLMCSASLISLFNIYTAAIILQYQQSVALLLHFGASMAAPACNFFYSNTFICAVKPAPPPYWNGCCGSKLSSSSGIIMSEAP